MGEGKVRATLSQVPSVSALQPKTTRNTPIVEHERFTAWCRDRVGSCGVSQASEKAGRIWACAR